jgi:hypothetical protein
MTNGVRVPRLAVSPPIAGPRMKPTPNAAPIRPKVAPLFSGGVTSAITA